MGKSFIRLAETRITLTMSRTSSCGGTFDKAFSLICEEPESRFEADFPPGADQIATLRNEPYGKERLEMELALRLEPRVREAHQS